MFLPISSNNLLFISWFEVFIQENCCCLWIVSDFQYFLCKNSVNCVWIRQRHSIYMNQLKLCIRLFLIFQKLFQNIPLIWYLNIIKILTKLKLFFQFLACRICTMMSLIHYFQFLRKCIALLYLILFLCKVASPVLSSVEVSNMLNHINFAFLYFFQTNIIHFWCRLSSLPLIPTISCFLIYFLFSNVFKIYRTIVQILISKNLNLDLYLTIY